MREKYEPRDIEQDRASEEHGVGPPEVLAAALDRDQREERHHQIDQQDAVEQRAERSHQRATDLDVDEDDGERLEPVVIPKPRSNPRSQRR